jgi:hypothetical protein
MVANCVRLYPLGTRGICFWAVIVKYDTTFTTPHLNSWEEGNETRNQMLKFKKPKFFYLVWEFFVKLNLSIAHYSMLRFSINYGLFRI